MAEDASAENAPSPDLDGSGLRIALVCARFNSQITMRLLAGARRALRRLGVADADVTEVWVPGAFEIPLAAKVLASGHDAVVGLGAVIEGETDHYEHVAGQAAAGLREAGLETGVACVFGVLTTNDLDQALARSQPEGGHNVGEDGAATAVEMARLLPTLGA